MNHFLARLVERARGTMPRVEAVVAPRFASAPITEIAAEIDAAAPLRSQETQPPPRNEPSGPEIVRPEIESPRTEPNRREEPAAVREPEQMLVPRKILVSHPPRSIVRRIAPDDVAVPSAANGSRLRESLYEVPGTRPGSAPPATIRAPVAGGVDPGRLGTRQASRRAAIQPNESNAETPIIRVTIGRIDVRATPAAGASSKASRRSEPKLTLDAYLKSRREGAR